MEVKQLRELYEAVIYVIMQSSSYEYVRTSAGWLEDFKTFFAKGHEINYSQAAFKFLPIYNSLVSEENQLRATWSFRQEHGKAVMNYLEREGIIQWNHKDVTNPEVKLTNFEAPRRIFEGTKYLLSTYKGTDGKIRSIRIKSLQEGAALFAFLRDPDAYAINIASGSGLDSEIIPRDVQSRRKVLSPETKKKFSMRSTVAEHFEICMSFITGKDMRWCLGISHITNPMTWTPTKVDETKERFVYKIDEILRLNQSTAACYEQMNLLKKLYEEHGEGLAFLNWAAAEVEAKLFEDPGKYIGHKVFGTAAKAMLACG